MSENEQSIGTARLDLVVDMTRFDPAITAAQGRITSMSTAAQAQYAAMTAAQKRQVDSLIKQSDTLGLARDQQLVYNASTKLSGALLDEYVQRLARAKVAQDALTSSTAASADASKTSAAALSNSQLLKANQALASFQGNSAPSLGDAQFLKANQGLTAYRAGIDAIRQAQDDLNASEAETTARIKAVVQASVERSIVDAAALVNQQRTVTMTDAQAAAVNRIKSAKESQSSVDARAQSMLDAENRSRQASVASIKSEGDALQKLIGQIDPSTAALSRLDKMEAQLRAHRASGSLSQDDFDVYTGKIAKARSAVTDADAAVSHFSLTSNGAGREVGYLVGEIARGDWGSFQGSLLTLANRTGLLSALFSPLAIGIAGAAAELGLFAFAATDAYLQEQKLNQSIAISGNFAGVTAASFAQMASGIGESTGHLGEARDILNSLVASGRVSGATLEAVGQAAFDMAQLTGKSADEAAQAATSMFDGTTASLLKANEQYHFLTDATYEQIKALEDEGRSQDAVRVAAEAFHDAIQPRLQTMQDSVYGIAKGWRDAKAGFNDFADTFKTGASLIAGTASYQTRIYDLLGKKQAAQHGALNAAGRSLGTVINPDLLALLPGGVGIASSLHQSFTPDDQALLDSLQAKAAKTQQDAADQATKARLNDGSVNADVAIDKLSSSVDKLAGKKAALTDLTKQFEALWAGADPNNPRLQGVQRIVGADGTISFAGGLYDKLKGDLDKKFADTSGTKVANADNTAQLAALKAELTSYTDAYANAQKELDAQRKASSIGEAAYYQQSHDLLWQSEGEQVTAIQAEIARLQARSVAGAEAVKNQQQIAMLQAQAQKIEADTFSKEDVLDQQEAAAKAKATEAVNAYIAALGQQTAARQAQIDLQIAGIGMGDKEYAQLQRITKIQQDSANQQVKLTAQLNTVGVGGIDQDTYDKKTAALKAATDARVKAEIDGQAQIDSAQDDWTKGAQKALTNYSDKAADVAGQTASVFTDAFNNMGTSLLTFVTTGKFSFKDFATSVLKDLAQMEIRIAESKALQAILGAFTGGTPTAVSSSDNNAMLSSSVNSDISGFTFNAKGGAYDSADLSRYSGQIVNHPTMFAFAKGAGVMGEAGPEGILPLQRGPDGRLGVSAHGTGGTGDISIAVDVSVDNTGNAKATTKADQDAIGAQFNAMFQNMFSERFTKEQRPGGLLWKMRVGQAA